jgi:phage shock protein A
MGFFSKLFTALRGTTHEVGEAIIDSQALKILEQEMRDARKHLEEARENLARVIAEQMGVEREVKRLQKAVEEYENYAIQALEKNNENLASEIAEKVAELENELEAQKSMLTSYDSSVKTLKEYQNHRT